MIGSMIARERACRMAKWPTGVAHKLVQRYLTQFASIGPPQEDSVLVRDSKEHEVILRFTRSEWAAFVAGVKSGEADL